MELSLTHVEHSTNEHASNTNFLEHLQNWQIALLTAAAIGFVLFSGHYLIQPIFRFISATRLRELFTATALMIVIGIALLMSLVGLSPALGTFLAGVVLANSEYRHELESDIAPFKGLLLGLFFMTVGANINFNLLADNLSTILLLTLGLMLLKALVLFVLALAFKIQAYDKWLLALGLAQAGEFGFVLLSFTVASFVIPKAIADQLMIVVALSMLLTPLIFIVLDKFIASRYAKKQQVADAIDEQGDIIIIGHGRMGGIVNRMLIVAIDNKKHITDLVEYVVKTYPHVHIVARAIDRTHVYDLWSVGCRDIIRETYDSSLRMGRSAFEALGISKEEANLLCDEFESLDRAYMVEAADLYKRNVPLHENQPYVDKVKQVLADWEEQLKGRIQLRKEKTNSP